MVTTIQTEATEKLPLMVQTLVLLSVSVQISFFFATQEKSSNHAVMCKLKVITGGLHQITVYPLTQYVHLFCLGASNFISN